VQREAEVRDAGVRDLACPPADAGVDWPSLYANYFGPGTAGHCGNHLCHDGPSAGGVPHGGWVCGATADSCYHGMLARVSKGRPAPLINLRDPPASLLIDPVRSPLAWFAPLGNMPFDNAVVDSCAARDVPRWLVPDGGHP